MEIWRELKSGFETRSNRDLHDIAPDIFKKISGIFPPIFGCFFRFFCRYLFIFPEFELFSAGTPLTGRADGTLDLKQLEIFRRINIFAELLFLTD